MEIRSFSKLLFSVIKTENLIKSIKKSFIPPKSARRKLLFENKSKNYIKENKFNQKINFPLENIEIKSIITNKNELHNNKYTNKIKHRIYSSVQKYNSENKIKIVKPKNCKKQKHLMDSLGHNSLEYDKKVTKTSPNCFHKRKIKSDSIKTNSITKKNFVLSSLRNNLNDNQGKLNENKIKYIMKSEKNENSKNSSNEKTRIQKYISRNFIDYLNTMDVGVNNERINKINEKVLKNYKKRLALFRNEKYLYNNNINTFRDYDKINYKKNDSNYFYSSMKIKKFKRMITLNNMK